jgi:hypothetical protein
LSEEKFPSYSLTLKKSRRRRRRKTNKERGKKRVVMTRRRINHNNAMKMNTGNMYSDKIVG